MTMLELRMWEAAKPTGAVGIHFKELCRKVKPRCIGKFLDAIASLEQQGMIDIVGEDLLIVAVEKEG